MRGREPTGIVDRAVEGSQIGAEQRGPADYGRVRPRLRPFLLPLSTAWNPALETAPGASCWVCLPHPTQLDKLGEGH